MGNAATRSPERVAASMGQAGTTAVVEFSPAVDVPQAGVMLALPALVAMGLLRHSERLYRLPPGYYGAESIFLVLAFMALARIPSLEQLRYQAPGEWGKLVGLDRIPEVRCLRSKLKLLCAADGAAAAWNTALAKEWMEAAPDDQKALFYADGHVRVYHGGQTQLPRHYVSRQRLCLRATTDYWLNAMDGQPLFYVNKESDPGLLEVLRKDLVPWIEANLPRPEAPSDPQADPPLWFTIVCDREVYSPGFFLEMNGSGIAVMTYHKFPGPEWPVEEFQSLAVPLVGGETTAMDLAERATTLSNGLEVREIRKRTETGKQVAIISTNRSLPRERLASAMFARWSQENFYKYMRQHYALDSLASYEVGPVPETVLVVNPVRRKLDADLRALGARRQRLGAEYSAVVLNQPLGNSVPLFQTRKAGLQEQIDDIAKQIDDLKQRRKSASRRVPIGELPEDQRFQRLVPERKHFLDTVKMICYRAETAMASILRPWLARSDDARSLLRQIYQTEADLVPDYQAMTLTVQLHHLTQQAHDKAVRELCAELNLTETLFPGTKLKLVYQIGSA